MKRLMNDFASQDLLLICRDYMPPGPPSALCGMFYIKSHCSNSSNQMNEEWILYTFPKSRIRSSTACEVVLCAVFLMSVLSYFTPLSLWAYVVIGGCVCMSFPCCKCDHSCLSQSQLRVCGTLMFCGRRVGWQHRLSVRWSWKTITVRSVIEHMRRFTHLRRDSDWKWQKIEKRDWNWMRVFLCCRNPLFSSPLSSLLLSSPLLHTQQPQCYDGSDVGLGGQTGSAPLPPLCAYVNGEAEKERGESYF